MAELDDLQKQALSELAACNDEAALSAWHHRYLDGAMRAALQEIGKKPTPGERKAFGQHANQVKGTLESAHAEKAKDLKEKQLQESLEKESLDVTLPGRAPRRGRMHLSAQTLRRMTAIFADLGFQVYRSRDVEDDETNFGLLNMPPHHPARDMWDTFHTTTPGVLLRTHTSPGQIHVMREQCPRPIRVILPGMCYRYEAVTMRHEMMFHQVEGLCISPGVTMADLKGTLIAFAQRMFGAQRRVQIRSSYFPFTEPSIEVDMDCIVCAGKGCALCRSTGWLEILGAGMVHPVVLCNGGYDPAKHTGFAFGMGVERIAMLQYGLDDIRQFWINDLRFLRQFGT
jgi:phenylalanyl-tRNA synthetase alpha chain